MRKILSIALAFIMVFALAMPALAAPKVLTVGTMQTGTVTDSGLAYTFTPAESSVYRAVFAANGKAALVGTVAYDDQEMSVWMGAEDEPTEGILEFPAVKGKTYTVKIEKGYDGMGIAYPDTAVSVVLSKVTTPTMTEGKNTVPFADTYFLFTPAVTALYNFRSDAKNGTDPFIYVIDGFDFDLFNDDNGREGEANFDLTVELISGKTYCINTICCGDETEEGGIPFTPYTVTVTRNKDIPVEELLLYDEEGTDNFLIPYGRNHAIFVTIVPSGAIPTADLSFRVEDESILALSYDSEFGFLTATPLKTGKTTFTVTAASGATVTVNAQVMPGIRYKIVQFFRNIFNYLRFIFGNIFG